MEDAKKLFLWITLGGLAVLFVSCGALNALLGTTGYAPGANTPAGQQAAANVDFTIWQYLGQLFGVQPVTSQGPPQLAQTGTVLTLGMGAKKIAKGTLHVTKSVGSGVAHAARTVRGVKTTGNPG